jgi:hypothetical protein
MPGRTKTQKTIQRLSVTLFFFIQFTISPARSKHINRQLDHPKLRFGRLLALVMTARAFPDLFPHWAA